jgi:hypothetical protein
MPLAVVHDERDHHAVRGLVISCDKCGARVDDRKIMKCGGLFEMGWLRRFNSDTRRNEYFCPKHN